MLARYRAYALKRHWITLASVLMGPAYRRAALSSAAVNAYLAVAL